MNSIKFTTKKTNRNDESEQHEEEEKNKNKKICEENILYEKKMLIEKEKNIKDENKKVNETINEEKIQNKDKINFLAVNIESNKNIENKNNNDDMALETLSEINSKNSQDQKKTKKKRVKEKTKEENNKYILKLKSNSKEREKLLNKGFKQFTGYEWDIYFYLIMLITETSLNNFKDFNEDYSYYVYNNLRGIRTSKEFNNIIKNPPNNEKLYEEAFLIFNERNLQFLNIAKKYNIKNLQFYINNKNNINNNNLNVNANTTNNTPASSQNNSTDKTTNNPTERITQAPATNNTNNANNNNNTSNANTNNNNNSNNTNNTNNTNNPNNNNFNNNNPNINKSFNNLREEYKLELFTSSLINNLLIRNEKEQEKYEKRDKNSIIQTKFEILNFNILEESMMGIITGIKFYTNITEINLSGNIMGSKSLFWLGSVFKTNSNIRVLDLTRCNIDNDCLYMFVEGTKYKNENLNNEQLNLDRLNLKDNNQITDTKNDEFEHPLGLLLEKFKLKWLNLTNAKLSNNGVCKFLKVYLNLMKQNKIFMENLILICNNFGNESCLDILGDILELKDICTLKNLILSKNLISTIPEGTIKPVNYFAKFMKSVANSNLKELFLISCGIGKNRNDIEILYDMLCQNKSLVSLRLFGNEINNMEDFTKILGIFSEYNNGLKNNVMKSLDLSKNSCNIKITEQFLELIDKLKLEYLDINQNTMDPTEKETFRKRTNELNDIKIIY